MNHSSTDDDPYYHQSTSSGPSSSGGGGSYRVYTQKLQGGSAENPPSVVEPGHMNAYIDNFLVGDDKNPSDVSSTEAYVTSHPLSSRSKADEDLDTLMHETADMSDIQGQIEEERHKMASKYRDEHTRQRRAAQARSRYQRMTENERKIYNQRRRMRQMGVDPTNESNPGPLDNLVKTQARQANARKAEAARQRYHRMTPEQRKDYNQRRTEAFRRRREEEEKLLSTPAGRISAEALAKAQQIMVRNARKAESARLRYQRMTVEQRKAYNLRRAATKRTRKYINTEHVDFPENFLAALESGGATEEPFEDDEDVDDEQEDEEEDEDHLDMSDLGDMPISSEIGHQSLEDFIVPDEATCELHMAEVINEVANSADSELSVFAQMESDVIRRTKKANTQILKKMVNNPGSGSSRNFNPYSSFMGGDLPNAQMIPSSEYADPSEPCTSSTPSATAVPSETAENRLIDEDALRQMIETGYDSNGMPVEVRTSDGQAIRTVGDLISRNVNHGQTVFITQRVAEQKPPVFHTNSFQDAPPTTSSLTQDNQVGSTTSSHLDQYMNDTASHEEECDFEDDDDEKVDSVEDSRLEAVRARRAERARARYHRMSEDQRREQNARRAATLRQARARDEELLKMCETTPLEQLDPETARQIKVAQDRRQRRAEQARNKYKRMSEEDRKRYNALRDASRKQRRVTAHQHFLDDSHEDPMEDPPTSSSPLDPDDPASFFYGVFPPKT